MNRWRNILAVLALAACAGPTVAYAQTSVDTTHAAQTRRRTDALRAESRRPTKPRATVIRTLAAEIDSLENLLLNTAPPATTPVPSPPIAVNQAPIAVISRSCTFLMCTFDGRGSTDDVGIASYSWNLGYSTNGTSNVTAATPTASATYPHDGSRTVTLTVTDTAGLANTASITFDVAAASSTPPPTPPSQPGSVDPPSGTASFTTPTLPRTVPDSVATVGGTIVNVSNGGDLQAAFNAAVPGTTIKLAASATFTGNFTIPPLACGSSDAWVTVTTNTTLPAAGTRVTPTTAASSNYAKIVAANSAPTIKTAGPGPRCRWQFIGVEISNSLSTTATINYGIIWLGDGGWTGGGETQTLLARVPQDFILDRVYVHGADSTNSTRCIALNSGRTAIINSWISNCHARGFDAQAISGWNGPGPYLIRNNHIEGSGENLMFGGADGGISGLSPSDITIERNYFYKPTAWRGVWTVKNLFELKNAKYVRIRNNVFQNSWADAQAGMAIVLKSSSGDQQAGTAPWSQTADVTFEYNKVDCATRSFNIQGIDGPVNSATIATNFLVQHNLFTNIGTCNNTTGNGYHIFLADAPTNVTFSHNTFINNAVNGGIAVWVEGTGGSNLVINDNVATSPAGYGIGNSGIQAGTASLNAFAGVGGWSFARNVLGGITADLVGLHPTTSYYAQNIDGTGGIGFTNYAGGTYTLSNLSPYKGLGLSSTDPGADIATINTRTSGVVVAP